MKTLDGKVVVDHRRRLRHRPGAGARRGRQGRGARARRLGRGRPGRDRPAGADAHPPGGPHRQGRRPRPRGRASPGRRRRRRARPRQRDRQQRRRRAARRLRGGDLRATSSGSWTSTSGASCSGTKEFLPYLIASGDGHVVNVSSLFGLIGDARPDRVQRGEVRGPRLHRGAAPGDARSPAPGRGDLRAPRRHQDRASPATPAPPGATTRPRSRSYFDKKLARMTPERAAEIIVDGMLRDQAARARRRRRQGARLAAADHRRALPAADRDRRPEDGALTGHPSAQPRPRGHRPEHRGAGRAAVVRRAQRTHAAPPTSRAGCRGGTTRSTPTAPPRTSGGPATGCHFPESTAVASATTLSGVCRSWPSTAAASTASASCSTPSCQRGTGATRADHTAAGSSPTRRPVAETVSRDPRRVSSRCRRRCSSTSSSGWRSLSPAGGGSE